MGKVTALLLGILLFLGAACSSTQLGPGPRVSPPPISSKDSSPQADVSPRAGPSRPSEAKVREEWRGQIVEMDRARGYLVVRSKERLLDHVFRITAETKIEAGTSPSTVLEPGQWVAVEYQSDATRSGPPVAFRITVILP